MVLVYSRAVVVTEQQRITAEEFFAVAEGDHLAQLVDGAIVRSQPTDRHQRLVVNVAYALEAWSRAEPGRGRPNLSVDVQLDEHNVYAPDLWWVPDDRVPLGGQELEGVPALVVEVRSPSTWRHDIGVKKRRYGESGVAELWLVDTESGSVLVFRRSTPREPDFDLAVERADGETLTSPLLPGFAVPVAELFDR